MNKRKRLDNATRTIILKYIVKYGDYKARYEADRERAMHAAPEITGLPRGSGISNPTLASVQALERLESEHYVRVMRAIESAREMIGCDIEDDDERETLKRAVWLSCQNRYAYPFEAFAGAVCCERTKFYDYKWDFIRDVKERIGL